MTLLKLNKHVVSVMLRVTGFVGLHRTKAVGTSGCIGLRPPSFSSSGITDNVSGLCVVARSRNLELTTTLDRAITQNPCYVPLNLEQWKNI
jgi:hypothetical protein